MSLSYWSVWLFFTVVILMMAVAVRGMWRILRHQNPELLILLMDFFRSVTDTSQLRENRRQTISRPRAGMAAVRAASAMFPREDAERYSEEWAGELWVLWEAGASGSDRRSYVMNILLNLPAMAIRCWLSRKRVIG